MIGTPMTSSVSSPRIDVQEEGPCKDGALVRELLEAPLAMVRSKAGLPTPTEWQMRIRQMYEGVIDHGSSTPPELVRLAASQIHKSFNHDMDICNPDYGWAPHMIISYVR